MWYPTSKSSVNTVNNNIIGCSYSWPLDRKSLFFFSSFHKVDQALFVQIKTVSVCFIKPIISESFVSKWVCCFFQRYYREQWWNIGGQQSIHIIDCQCMDFIHRLEGVSYHVVIDGNRFSDFPSSGQSGFFCNCKCQVVALVSWNLKKVLVVQRDDRFHVRHAWVAQF